MEEGARDDRRAPRRGDGVYGRRFERDQKTFALAKSTFTEADFSPSGRFCRDRPYHFLFERRDVIDNYHRRRDDREEENVDAEEEDRRKKRARLQTCLQRLKSNDFASFIDYERREYPCCEDELSKIDFIITRAGFLEGVTNMLSFYHSERYDDNGIAARFARYRHDEESDDGGMIPEPFEGWFAHDCLRGLPGVVLARSMPTILSGTDNLVDTAFVTAFGCPPGPAGGEKFDNHGCTPFDYMKSFFEWVARGVHPHCSGDPWKKEAQPCDCEDADCDLGDDPCDFIPGFSSFKERCVPRDVFLCRAEEMFIAALRGIESILRGDEERRKRTVIDDQEAAVAIDHDNGGTPDSDGPRSLARHASKDDDEDQGCVYGRNEAANDFLRLDRLAVAVAMRVREEINKQKEEREPVAYCGPVSDIGGRPLGWGVSGSQHMDSDTTGRASSVLLAKLNLDWLVLEAPGVVCPAATSSGSADAGEDSAEPMRTRLRDTEGVSPGVADYIIRLIQVELLIERIEREKMISVRKESNGRRSAERFTVPGHKGVAAPAGWENDVALKLIPRHLDTVPGVDGFLHLPCGRRRKGRLAGKRLRQWYLFEYPPERVTSNPLLTDMWWKMTLRIVCRDGPEDGHELWRDYSFRLESSEADKDRLVAWYKERGYH